MNHDPLCEWWQNRCESECNVNLAYGDPCEHMWCTCVLIAKVRSDQDAKYVNPNCMWGQAECIANCPTCKRLDQLYAERVAGYKEGNNDALKNKECLHHGRDIWHDGTPYCSNCGKDTSYEYEMGN